MSSEVRGVRIEIDGPASASSADDVSPGFELPKSAELAEPWEESCSEAWSEAGVEAGGLRRPLDGPGTGRDRIRMASDGMSWTSSSAVAPKRKLRISACKPYVTSANRMMDGQL